MDIKKMQINSMIKKINKLILKYGKQEIIDIISHEFGLDHHHHEWNSEKCCSNDNDLIQKKHIELNHSHDNSDYIDKEER